MILCDLCGKSRNPRFVGCKRKNCPFVKENADVGNS